MNPIPKTPDPDLLSISELPMPRLSDEAVVQIHDFLHHVFELFEARYAAQIHRFYEGLCGDCPIDLDTAQGSEEPDF